MCKCGVLKTSPWELVLVEHVVLVFGFLLADLSGFKAKLPIFDLVGELISEFWKCYRQNR